MLCLSFNVVAFLCFTLVARIWLRLWSINTTNHQSKIVLILYLARAVLSSFGKWHNKRISQIYNDGVSHINSFLREFIHANICRVRALFSSLISAFHMVNAQIVYALDRENVSIYPSPSPLSFSCLISGCTQPAHTSYAIEWQIHLCILCNRIRFVLVRFSYPDRVVIISLKRFVLWGIHIYLVYRQDFGRFGNSRFYAIFIDLVNLGCFVGSMDLFKIDWNERYMPITWNKND